MLPAENRKVIHKTPLRDVKVDKWQVDCDPWGGLLKVIVQRERERERIKMWCIDGSFYEKLKRSTF